MSDICVIANSVDLCLAFLQTLTELVLLRLNNKV